MDPHFLNRMIEHPTSFRWPHVDIGPPWMDDITSAHPYPGPHSRDSSHIHGWMNYKKSCETCKIFMQEVRHQNVLDIFQQSLEEVGTIVLNVQCHWYPKTIHNASWISLNKITNLQTLICSHLVQNMQEKSSYLGLGVCKTILHLLEHCFGQALASTNFSLLHFTFLVNNSNVSYSK